MNIAALSKSIIIALQEGDRPAIITKVFANTSVEACGYMPLPEHLKLVMIHRSRAEAINAGLKGGSIWHAYWPEKV